MVLQKTPGGVHVPKVSDVLDLTRFEELARQADLGVNLWASLKLAAERGDNAVVKLNCQQIQILTRSTFALAKRLGNEEPDDARE
jgi:hypothetical protein